MPFYFKEGENLEKWEDKPKEILDKDGREIGVAIYSVKGDTEKIKVWVVKESSAYVLRNQSASIFPGHMEDLNKEGFEVKDRLSEKTVATVIYSEKPIEGK